MTRVPRVDEILNAIEGAARAYMEELPHVQQLSPQSRLQFITLGRDILELEARTHKMFVSLRQDR